MRNYFKKFSIMFVMALAIIGIGMIYGGNGANAATVGQQLTSPESGWRRYDDTDNKINYLGNWGKAKSVNYYNNGDAYTRSKSDSYNFKFYGSKLRIISNMAKDRVNTIVNIDGVDYSYSSYSSITKDSIYLVFDTTLELGVHNVNVKNTDSFVTSSNYLVLDAIDIDDIGCLLPIDYNKLISLDKSSMDLSVGDTQQLTATTTPAGAQVTWKSSEPNIASVTPSGQVTGENAGTCTITATINDGYNVISATCTVTVTKKDDPQPSGDENLYIQLVNGDVKKYTVTNDGFNKFKQWYIDRVDNKAGSPIYKFDKDSNEDYVICDKIEWFEIRK